VSRERQGLLLCLLTATVWSTTAIFAKLAFDDGVSVTTLVVFRNAVGAIPLWFLVRVTRQPLPTRQMVARGFLLGMLGYSGQTGLFAASLSRIDAGIASMLLYTYPAMVMVGALLIGRESLSPRRVVALALATAGAALVLSGSIGASVDLLGMLLALGSALSYTVSVLIGHAMLRRLSPTVLAALTTSGAATSFILFGAMTRSVSFDFEARGWLLLFILALVPTLVGSQTSLAGVSRVGPSRATILFTLEVPLTVFFAALLLGERLTLVQLTGGVLVVLAIITLQLTTAALPDRLAARFARRSSAGA
jgi:drug/metabolite transporter (DMT)-like permease